ncbi:baseplate J/gp47 family protein [Christiangramia sp.]|uniref:baseplate J/gp47 family protein n=1 Tax=Christiangramia sp. TaxID=1931228 RepID=UPI00262EEB0A|nr:baseplate J/gp47 family protein [Christiangramia sp.]
MNPTPTIQQLNDQISKDLKSKLNLSDDQLRKVLAAFSAVSAAQFKLAYLYLADIQNNLFPDTADLAVNGGELERFGRIYLNRDPNPAAAGVFNISLTGVNGSVIRSGLTFKSNDDAKNPGQLFVTDAEYIMTGTNDIIEIRSLKGGVEYDLEIGNELTITEPVIGVEKTVTVAEVVAQPKAPESVEDYRQAILDAIQLEPQGGAKTDYMIWAKDAQGVRRVYPYVKNTNAGTVQVFVEATIEDSTDTLGTPSQALLDEVAAVVEQDPDESKPVFERGRRPIQAALEVLPIVLRPVDVDITGLNENTTSIQDGIQTNIREYIRTVRPFIDGADLLRNKNDILYAARLQSVVTDVLESSNFFTDFVVKVDGVPMTANQFSGADIPYLRDINYL